MNSSSQPVIPPVKVKGYCVSCKAKRVMVGATKITLQSHRDAMKGKCKKYNNKMFKFVKK
jgi:hypothetical protein